MSGSTFPGRLGADSNPFGSSAVGSTQPAGNIGRIGEEEEDTITSPTTGTFGQAGSLFGGDGTFGGPPSSFKPTGGPAAGFPNNYGMGRRTSVSAESLNPNATENDNWTPPVNPKSEEQTKIIKTALSGHSLFNKLDEDQSNQLALAMTLKDIPAKDIKVITQGDQGDFFYVVEKGSFDVYINSSGKFQPGPDGLGKKVATINQGGSFGELALMYGHPRNATVISAEQGCKLLQLDRVTFRMIVIQNTFTRRRMYEAFLTEVPLFQSLDDAERAKIADALQQEKFGAGHTIIQEGDKGEAFYLLESGEAEAFKSGIAEPVKKYGKGEFFGELALLNDAPRAASVISKTEVKVARLEKEGFSRLLGPVEGILRRTKYDEEEVDPLQKA